MKILFISSFLPFPLYSGGHIRLFNIIKRLSKRHEITLVCEKRDYQTNEDIKEVEKICRTIIVFNRKKQWSFKNILKSGFSNNSFLVTGHTIPEMKKSIQDLFVKEKFDFIHVETFYVMQNLPQDISIPVVLVEHNIEYLVYKRYAVQAPFFLKPLLNIDILKLKIKEKMFWQQATKLIAVSQKEKEIMLASQRSGNLKDVEVVPNGVDIYKFKIKNLKSKIDDRERKLLFIGDFRWVENRDAATWLLKEIWPELKSKIKSQKSKISLWIVGREISSDIKQLGDGNVKFDEHAPSDASLIYQNADILLAPIRVGGGTSFKILEAMSSGVPVITTTLGNEGIGAKENEEIIITNNNKEFVEKTFQLLENEKLYETISKNARKFIENKYDWDQIVKRLESIYESLAF